MPCSLNGTDKGKVVVSWTGGKDGCFACYRAMAEVYLITHLLNFRNIKNIGSLEINPEIIQAQSEAIGIPLHTEGLLSYEQEFKKLVSDLLSEGSEDRRRGIRHIETP